MTTGQKIKARRLELGYTQARVAGDRMTRNMISLIENGQCEPSLSTLSYLAEQLEIGAAYFLDEDSSSFLFDKERHIHDIRRAYKEKRFEFVLKSIEKIGQTDDELAFLATTAAAELGHSCLKRGSLESAKVYFDRALDYADQTVYDTELIRTKLLLWSAIAKNIQSPRLHFEQEEYENRIDTMLESEFYLYFLGNTEHEYKIPVLALHARARALMRTRSYREAVALLQEAEKLAKEGDAYDAYVMLGVYSDLELCYKDCGDFENAYRYSTRRLSMAEWFKT